jgi:hypothetical protein
MSVNIDNFPQGTLLVRDVDNPAIQPVNAAGHCSTGAVADCGATVFDVPEGKRLVIEYVSVETRLPHEGFVTFSRISVSGSSGGTQWLTMAPPAADVSVIDSVHRGRATIGQQIRLYAGPGATVSGYGVAFSSSEIFFRISGHLVDVP